MKIRIYLVKNFFCKWRDVINGSNDTFGFMDVIFKSKMMSFLWLKVFIFLGEKRSFVRSENFILWFEKCNFLAERSCFFIKICHMWVKRLNFWFEGRDFWSSSKIVFEVVIFYRKILRVKITPFGSTKRLIDLEVKRPYF